MPRRRQQRKKISKFEFARRKEHQLRFGWEYFKDPEERRFCRDINLRAVPPGEMKGGRNGMTPAFLCPP